MSYEFTHQVQKFFTVPKWNLFIPYEETSTFQPCLKVLKFVAFQNHADLQLAILWVHEDSLRNYCRHSRAFHLYWCTQNILGDFWLACFLLWDATHLNLNYEFLLQTLRHQVFLSVKYACELFPLINPIENQNQVFWCFNDFKYLYLY